MSDQTPCALIACDSFKGTIGAGEVCEALARGVVDGGLRAEECPLADGGEGTARILLGAVGGEFVECPAHDALGRPLRAGFALLDDGRAVIDVAAASGLALIAEAERDPWRASSAGTGELIVAAAAAGATELLVAAGGSASVDGGAGALAAITRGGGLRGARLTVLADVTTPFEEAAVVFGEQKGASPSEIARLSHRLERQAAALRRDPRGVAMTGCAGGLSGALWSQHGATLRSGAMTVLDALDFRRRAARASIVVTGEGRLDRQSVQGKLVGEVARICRELGRPLHAVVGSDSSDAAMREELGLAGIHVAGELDQLEAVGHALARESARGRAGRDR